MIVGYARVSTAGQDLEVQRALLLDLGVSQERIYTDFGFSGKSLSRSGLDQARAAVRAGDTFVVPKFDRLARNVEDALAVMRELTDAGVVLQIGRQTYDPADPMSKMVMTILAAVAEAEGGWISLRTKEALARPSVRAKMRGKQPSLSPKTDELIAGHLDAGDMTVQEIAAAYKTSRASVYRAASRHRERAEKAQRAIAGAGES